MSVSEPVHGTVAPPPAKHRDRTHYLYVAVIVAVVAGIVVGLVAPDVGKALEPLGTVFVSLIKMMIAPVIFCTIVLGIGSVRKAAKVGKVGGLALLYFIVMSTVALAIGLVVGNLIHPGSGLRSLRPARPPRPGRERRRGRGHHWTSSSGIIPTTLFSALTRRPVLQTLFVALLVGFAVQALGSSGEPMLRGVEPSAPGLQDPGDDHVAGPDRCVRRDRRRRRRRPAGPR